MSRKRSKKIVQIPFRKQSVCERCPIYKSYGHEDYVPFEQVGDKPELAIVGEAPGNDEVKRRRPFVGKAGTLLREVLRILGIKSYLLLNAVSCRPRKIEGDGRITFREPKPEEYGACSIHARTYIKASGVKTILLAGKTAVKAFNHVFPENVTTWSLTQVMQSYPIVVYEGVKYIPIFHPSYVLRNSNMDMERYLSLVRRSLKNEPPKAEAIEYQILYRDEFLPWLKAHADSWKTIALDYETTTARPVEARKLVGIGVSNGTETVYFEMRLDKAGKLAPPDLSEEEAKAWKEFIETRDQVRVYNTSFESNVTYQITGKWFDFDDAYTLAKVGQVRDQFRGGGLKYVASKVLGVPPWSGDVSGAVKDIKLFISILNSEPFIDEHLDAIAEGRYDGLVFSTGKNLVTLGLTFEETIEKNPKLTKSEIRKIEKLHKQIVTLASLFGGRISLLREVRDLLEWGKKHGLPDEYLAWYAIPGKVLAEYNARDTYYTYRVFDRLYEKYGEWYPYYIKQEWLSSHMEGYMVAWAYDKADELATLYAQEAINHVEAIFKLPRFRKALLDYLRDNVTIKELEKNVSFVPKLSKLPKTTREKVRKKTANEFLSAYDELVTNATFLDKDDPSAAILASLKGSLEKAVDEYLRQVSERLDKSLEEARAILRESGDVAEAIAKIKEVFNPDSSHESTRTIFFNAFITDELKDLAFVDYVNQTYFRGVKRFHLGNMEELAEWVKAQPKSKKPSSRRFKNFYSDMTSGINDAFFKGWYQVFNLYYGVEVDNRETWKFPNEDVEQAWLLLYHTRVFKKIMKALNGYILAGKKDALGAYIQDPLKQVIAYGPYNGEGTPMLQSTFHANTAETKRWQSPMHTIPRGSDIRLLYVPRDENFVMVHFDYSQMEVRVLAGLAKDPILLEAYEKGIDVHRLTASRIFNKPPEEVTKEERSFAKMATFSVLYGKGVESFARDFLHGDVDKAKEIIKGFFAAYKQVDAWVRRMHEEARETGFVRTLFGDLIDVNTDKTGWDRRAQNYPIQSSASSLAALAGWELYQKARKLGMGVVVIGFTHDALDFEVDARDLPAFMVLARKIAVGLPRSYGVPADIDLEVGPNMGHMFGIEKKDDYYHIHGPKEGFDNLITRLSNRWELEYEITGESTERREERELFVTKTAYSISIGKEIPLVEAKLRLLALKN